MLELPLIQNLSYLVGKTPNFLAETYLEPFKARRILLKTILLMQNQSSFAFASQLNIS